MYIYTSTVMSDYIHKEISNISLNLNDKLVVLNLLKCRLALFRYNQHAAILLLSNQSIIKNVFKLKHTERIQTEVNEEF